MPFISSENVKTGFLTKRLKCYSVSINNLTPVLLSSFTCCTLWAAAGALSLCNFVHMGFRKETSLEMNISNFSRPI